MFSFKNYQKAQKEIEVLSKKTEIIAISKNHPFEEVEKAISFGLEIFGENRVQEAKSKFEEVFDKKYEPSKFDNILGIKSEKVSKQLKTAFVFGIIYFIAGFLEIFVDFLAFKDDWLFNVIYVFSKFISFISLVFFFRGFIIISGLHKNYLLQISTFLIIVFSLAFTILDISALYFSDDFTGVISFSKLITFGALSVILGIAFLRLKEFGDIAKWTGIFEIVTGVCWLLIILAPIGLFTQAVVEIFEIILIYKVLSSLKEKS